MKKVFSPCIRVLQEPVMDRIKITKEQESADDAEKDRLRDDSG